MSCLLVEVLDEVKHLTFFAEAVVTKVYVVELLCIIAALLAIVEVFLDSEVVEVKVSLEGSGMQERKGKVSQEILNLVTSSSLNSFAEDLADLLNVGVGIVVEVTYRLDHPYHAFLWLG